MEDGKVQDALSKVIVKCSFDDHLANGEMPVVMTFYPGIDRPVLKITNFSRLQCDPFTLSVTIAASEISPDFNQSVMPIYISSLHR